MAADTAWPTGANPVTVKAPERAFSLRLRLMLAAGVDRIVLRSQMGHCSEEMTERYAGVDPELKREAVELIEGQAEEEA